MSEKRAYRMDRRAQAQDETRERIVEAAMALHEEVGPRATTVSAIAERAGVQRLTVYRHFPDEAAVIQACSSHWAALNPAPDPGRWESIAEPRKRIRAALREFYAYYGRTSRMWASVRRDAAEVAAVREPLDAFDGFIAAVAEGLAAGIERGRRTRQQVTVTLQHALAFPTWEDLDALDLNDAAKVALVGQWVDGLVSR